MIHSTVVDAQHPFRRRRGSNSDRPPDPIRQGGWREGHVSACRGSPLRRTSTKGTTFVLVDGSSRRCSSRFVRGLSGCRGNKLLVLLCRNVASWFIHECGWGVC